MAGRAEDYLLLLLGWVRNYIVVLGFSVSTLIRMSFGVVAAGVGIGLCY